MVDRFWTTYEESSMCRTVFEILDNAGCLKDIEWRRVGCDYYINETQDCAKLIMNFIALSMPEDFTYKLIESEIEPINGYWNGELNAQLGYGYFLINREMGTSMRAKDQLYQYVEKRNKKLLINMTEHWKESICRRVSKA